MEPELRSALRKIEPAKLGTFPLVGLQGIHEIRRHLDELEGGAIERALELGASVEDVAEALGVTRQGVHYKLRKRRERGAGTSKVPTRAG